MTIMLSIAIACIILAFLVWRKKLGDTPGDIGCAVSFLLVGGLIAGFVLVFFISFIHPSYTQREVLNKTELVSLVGKDKLQGEFAGSFIGIIGTLGQEMTYDYWYQTDDGASKHAKLTDRDNVVIFEDAPEGTAYLLETADISYCDPDWEFKEWSLGCSTANWKPNNIRMEFNVPAGTLTNHISIN